jgi:hypothetical protein
MKRLLAVLAIVLMLTGIALSVSADPINVGGSCGFCSTPINVGGSYTLSPINVGGSMLTCSPINVGGS